MPLAAVVFDFDGVIANSEPLHFRAFREVAADRGVPLTEDEYYREFLGFDDVGAFKAMAIKHRIVWDADEIAAMVARKAERMEELERHTSVLFPGAADAVRAAAAAVPIAIASGALTAEIRRTLERERLVDLFTAIVGADQTAASKPAPDPYLLALDQLRAKVHAVIRARDCVALEDSRWGLESARAAGLRTIAVAQTYPASSLTADLVFESMADFDVSRLHALVGS